MIAHRDQNGRARYQVDPSPTKAKVSKPASQPSNPLNSNAISAEPDKAESPWALADRKVWPKPGPPRAKSSEIGSRLPADWLTAFSRAPPFVAQHAIILTRQHQLLEAAVCAGAELRAGHILAEAGAGIQHQQRFLLAQIVAARQTAKSVARGMYRIAIRRGAHAKKKARPHCRAFFTNEDNSVTGVRPPCDAGRCCPDWSSRYRRRGCSERRCRRSRRSCHCPA